MNFGRRFFSLTLIAILFVALFSLNALAGTTGKIAGQVVDAATGEPLIGANVIIRDSNRGAATDLDGYYYIINLPPGSYNVEISSVGYASQIFSEVTINIDKTTTMNVRLQPQALQGEEVTIIAKKPVIEVDRTFATATVGEQDLKVMPITKIQEAIDLQAGVVDGHFRGGRSSEVVYMIDGIPVQDIYDNKQSTQVSQDVVKELQVITGTFNAEYGQAMSGVVNMVTKDGGSQVSGMVGAEFGDYLSSHTEEFYNIDDVDPSAINNYQFSLSGPITEKIGFYINGRKDKNEGWMYGWNRFDVEFPGEYLALGDHWVTLTPDEQLHLMDSLGITSEMLNSDSDLYLHLLDVMGRGDNEAVSMNPDDNMYLFGKLSFQINPTTKLNYISMWEDREYRDFDREYINIPEADYNRFRHARTNSLKLTSSLSQSAFVEVGLSNSYTEYYHHVYEDILDERYYYMFAGIENYNPVYTTNVAGVKYEHFRRYSNSNIFQAKLSWQANKTHYIVGGANISTNEVFYRSLNDDISDLGPTFGYGDRMAVPGVDDFNHDHYRYKPIEGAVYIQDKIELETLVINAGIRFDYFDSKGKLLVDPRDPDVYHPIRNGLNLSNAQRLRHWYDDPTPKFQMSPRLGIGYPISESGVLHFAYGHFFQRPNYEYLYNNPEFEIKRQGTGLHTIIGNADLDAEQTISYEFGFDQALTSELSMGVSLYQRDIRGLVSADKIVETYMAGTYYAQYINRDIAEVRGVLLSLNKQYSNNFSASVDYTYQIAEGVASDPNAAYNAQSGDDVTEPIKQLIPLSWDRRHTLNVNFNYVVPQSWGFSVIGTVGSGLPYTINTSSSKIKDLDLSFENDGRKPTYINMDLNLFKQINLLKDSGINARFEMTVRNLFDRLNENDVFGDTGRATYRTDIPNIAGENSTYNTFNEFFYYYPNHYSRPREIRFGIVMEF